MSLAAGTKLGPYEITTPLGSGGMGEVYRAKDTRLGREVAIKVLPASLTANAESRARFEREARTVSSLNHPHICTLHDVGREGDTDYLVLELIEGETLAARLSRGALPTAEVLRLGAQIADALDRAHRAGVIHRDLKPGNVMLTRSGAKLMDFGLARATAIAAAPGSSSVTMSVVTPSPTMAGPLTAEGTIVGTFQYMAPEQLEGAEADARTDLWALGCLLYEMATARAAFTGRSAASLISAILTTEPSPASQVAGLSPPALDRLISACLAKDPADRVQSAHDVRLQLGWMAESSSVVAPALVGAPRRRWAPPAWVAWASLGFGAVALAAAAFVALGSRGGNAELTVLEVPLPRGLRVGDAGQASEIAPDGRSALAWGTDDEGRFGLWHLPFDGRPAQHVPGSEARGFFSWSPDSRSVAFFDGRAQSLSRVSVTGGGSPTRLCAMEDSRGVAWGATDVILFALAGGPIYRVAASGGTPAAATVLDSSRGEGSHRWPTFLPDGKRFLFAVLPGGSGGYPIYAGTLGSTKVKHVLDAESTPIYAEPGFLVYVLRGKIVARRFDLARLEPTGEPFPLLDAPPPTDFTAERVGSAARDGRLLIPEVAPQAARLQWFDRSGAAREEIALPEGDWNLRALSPDARFAFAFRDGQLWRIELARAVPTRLTPTVVTPVGLSPDGTRLALHPAGGATRSVRVLPIAGGGGVDSVATVSSLFQEVADWSPDGTSLLVAVLGREDERGTRPSWDLWTVPLDGTAPRPYLATGAFERNARISPDGKWAFCIVLADGDVTAHVASYPEPGRRVEVFANRMGSGSDLIAWGRDGREVLWIDRESDLWSLPLVPDGDGLRAGTPVKLFRAPKSVSGLRTLDGERFLLTHPASTAAWPKLRLATNWAEAIPR